MADKRILYISGSVGLGHVTRDIAIAREIRRQRPGTSIAWLAAHPATIVLEDAGEQLLPEAEHYANETVTAEKASKGFSLNLLKFAFHSTPDLIRDIKVLRRVLKRERFDLIVGDEAYKMDLALRLRRISIDIPYVLIHDFVGLDTAGWNPLERLLTYSGNFGWTRTLKDLSHVRHQALLVGEAGDIPAGRFGPLLPDRREWAKANYEFIGYVFPFDPADYADKAKIRAQLGYHEEPLVVCAIGGTSIGRSMLELCGQAFPIIRQKVRELRMVLVCGPRLSPDALTVPKGVEVRGYVPALYEHFAASDLAIVQSGGTTTLELTALRRPFIYLPVERHFEQNVHVAARLARHGAGIKLSYAETTPETLASHVVSNLGKEVGWETIPADGAGKAAELILRQL
ncbi:MAG: hypothetical protein JSU70_19290 [Phycisphaerales bacterium]|nr:MAG: hypothetical protein JSU70_19290 [Phycisphaerales bacterium]